MSFSAATIESALPVVWAPKVPESVSDVGCATTVTFAPVPEPACVASPAKLAVSRCTPGVRAARTGTVTRPSAPVVTGIPAPPRPTRTRLPASGLVPTVSLAVTEKVSLYSTVPTGGTGSKASPVAAGGGRFGSGGPGNRPRPVERARLLSSVTFPTPFTAWTKKCTADGFEMPLSVPVHSDGSSGSCTRSRPGPRCPYSRPRAGSSRSPRRPGCRRRARR